MEKDTLTKIKKAYHGFKEFRSKRCAHEFEITLDEWVDFFTQCETRKAIIFPSFKSKRLIRVDDTKPWTIANMNVVEVDQLKVLRALQSKLRKPETRKADPDGTQYVVLTVSEWIDTVRQTNL